MKDKNDILEEQVSDSSNSSLTDYIEGAQKSVDIYLKSISNVSFQKSLFSILKSNVKVRILTERSFAEDNLNLLCYLVQNGAEVSLNGKDENLAKFQRSNIEEQMKMNPKAFPRVKPDELMDCDDEAEDFDPKFEDTQRE